MSLSNALVKCCMIKQDVLKTISLVEQIVCLKKPQQTNKQTTQHYR